MYTVHRKSEPRHKDVVHLWEFLFELLADESCGSIIAWITEESGEFKLKNPKQVAKLWGAYKGVTAMNYEKLGRALRTYYSKGIIEKVSENGNFHRWDNSMCMWLNLPSFGDSFLIQCTCSVIKMSDSGLVSLLRTSRLRHKDRNQGFPPYVVMFMLSCRYMSGWCNITTGHNVLQNNVVTLNGPIFIGVRPPQNFG